MARKQARPPANQQVTLELLQTTCRGCGNRMRMGHHSHRTVTTLAGVTRLTLKVYRCRNQACPRFHQPTRPEEEGAWALPHGEFGLDVIALVGTLRYQQQRSIPQIHEELVRRGLRVAQRTVTDQLYRYEELVALHLADSGRLKTRLAEQQQVILALDGLQPVYWLLRSSVLKTRGCVKISFYREDDGSGRTSTQTRIFGTDDLSSQYNREDTDLQHLLKLLGGFPLALEVVLPNLARQTPTEVLEALQAGNLNINVGDSEKRTGNILRCIDYSHSNLSPEVQDLLSFISEK